MVLGHVSNKIEERSNKKIDKIENFIFKFLNKNWHQAL
jgi:hypothetical protein